MSKNIPVASAAIAEAVGRAQAMCEMLTIVGKKVEDTSKNKTRLEGYFAVLERWSKSKALASRTKFMIRDILDLRRSKWVPRRQKDQARVPSSLTV